MGVCMGMGMGMGVATARPHVLRMQQKSWNTRAPFAT